MPPLTEQSVIAVSGGGRGITAACAIALAAHYHCTFILLGRSRIDEPEPEWAQGIEGEAALRDRLVADTAAKGDKATPNAIRQSIQHLQARREVLATLASIEAAGGKALYYSADIADRQALSLAIADASSRLGMVTGILHGAGTLRDKLIENKTLADLKTVYAPKIEGLQNLLAVIPPGQLSHLILFSSAAGFYGNPGQSDYAIANEILNKAAYLVQQQNPSCAVLTFNWGPWDAGMVTEELKQLFAQREIALIPVEEGVVTLIEQIEKPAKGIQVLVGSPLGTRTFPVAQEPLMTYQIQRRIELAANPFLSDHIIGEHAVLPMAHALGWMADACEQLYPGWQVRECRQYRVLKGIVFDETFVGGYTLDLKETEKNAASLTFDATVMSVTLDGKPRFHYKAIVELAHTASPAIYATPPEGSAWADPEPGLHYYADGTLFHGPHFQGIEAVRHISQRGLNAHCRLPLVSVRDQGQFPVGTYNPFLADIQLQTMLIWARWMYGAGSLPLQIQKVEVLASVAPGQQFTVDLVVSQHSEHGLVADLQCYTGDNQLALRMSGAEVTLSKRLNTLFQQKS